MMNRGCCKTDTQQRAAAKAFAKNWKDCGYEKGDSQIIWVEFDNGICKLKYQAVYFFLKTVSDAFDHTSFIDIIEKTHVMIEWQWSTDILFGCYPAVRLILMLTLFEQAKKIFF